MDADERMIASDRKFSHPKKEAAEVRRARRHFNKALTCMETNGSEKLYRSGLFGGEGIEMMMLS